MDRIELALRAVELLSAIVLLIAMATLTRAVWPHPTQLDEHGFDDPAAAYVERLLGTEREQALALGRQVIQDRGYGEPD